MFSERESVESFTLMETKLKENGEISWCRVNSISASVQKIERVREVVAILINNFDE